MTDPRHDYPLAQKHPEWVVSPSGIPLQDITLEKVLTGEIDVDDPADSLVVTPTAD